MRLDTLTPAGALILTFFALLITAILATADWIKPDYARFIATFLLGGGSGAAIQANMGGKS